jgi:hypothetical protein
VQFGSGASVSRKLGTAYRNSTLTRGISFIELRGFFGVGGGFRLN